MSAVSPPHLLAPSEHAAGWTDAVQPPGRSGAPTVSTRFEHGRCRRAGARGLVVSPCSLGEDHLVQSQIRDRAPKTGVLRLQILHPLNLIAPSARRTPDASDSMSPQSRRWLGSNRPP